MFKITLILSSLAFLYIQFSTGNVIQNNTELDNKISKMWEAVDYFRMRVKNNNLAETEDKPLPLVREVTKINSNVLRRLNEHYSNIEKQARETGELDNVLVDSVYFTFLFEEIKSSQFFLLLNEEVKKSNDINVQKIIFELVNKVEIVLHEFFPALIQEMTTNPRKIFEDQTSEESVKIINKYENIKFTYYNKVMNYKEEAFIKLQMIGKEHELEIFINHIKSMN